MSAYWRTSDVRGRADLSPLSANTGPAQLRHPLQRQLADEVRQPRNERLVDLQVERRLRELLAVAHEYAALTHQRDGGAHGVLVRGSGREETPHELGGAGEKRHGARLDEIGQHLAGTDVLPREDAYVSAHLIAGKERTSLLMQELA